MTRSCYIIIAMFSLSSISQRLGSSLCRARQSSPHHFVPTALSPLSLFTRGRGQLAPKQVKYAKRHKGRIPIPIGGSTKGTTLAYGDWGIRIKGNGVRFSAKQLTTAQEVIVKKLKVLKGAKVYLRVFPDIPVCVKVSGSAPYFAVSVTHHNRGMKLVWVKEKEHSSTGLLGEQFDVYSLFMPYKFIQRPYWTSNFRDRWCSYSRRVGP